MRILNRRAATGVGSCLVFVALASGLCAQTHDLSVQITDVGGSNTPIVASGQVSFHEVPSAESVKTQWSIEVRMLNVSGKTILAYEVSIRAMPDRGGPVVHTARADYFFRSELRFVTGSEETLNVPMRNWHVTPLEESARPKVPKASFEVIFVEFADGSKFGTSEWGSGLSAVRAQTIERLQSVSRQSQNSGEDGLRLALANEIGAGGDSEFARAVLNDVKTTLDDKGWRAATEQINGFLEAAKERYTAFRTKGP